MSQVDQIAEWLAAGKEIDPRTALREFGCFRLAARIFELRDQGLSIAERTEYAGKKHWSVYRLAIPH